MPLVLTHIQNSCHVLQKHLYRIGMNKCVKWESRFYIHSSYINTCTYTQNLTQSALFIRTFHDYIFYIILNMGHKISRIWFMGLWLTDTISHGSIFVFFDDLFKITSLNSIEMCYDFIYGKLFYLKLFLAHAVKGKTLTRFKSNTFKINYASFI